MKELIVGPQSMDTAYMRAVISPRIQEILHLLPILPYHIKVPAKTLQYENDGLVVDGCIYVRLPHSEREKTQMMGQKDALIHEIDTIVRYIYEEGEKLKIQGGDHTDLANLSGIWQEAKRKKSVFGRGWVAVSSFLLGLLGKKDSIKQVVFPFPLFRDSFLHVFSGTKAQARRMIFEELRLRYENKRDIQKVAPKIVVTPNLDHLRMLYVEKSKIHKEVYEKSWLQTADGAPPLVVFGRQSIGYLPKEQITGVDLFMEIINVIGQEALPYTIYFIGGFGNIPYKTRDYFISIYPNLKDAFVGISTPPLGFLDDEEKMKAICKDIDEKKPDLIFAGLTMITQERLPLELIKRGVNFGMLLGVGRAIELVVGYQKRPPLLFKKLHIEWLHRAFTGNPGKGFSNTRYIKRVIADFRFVIRAILFS